MSAEREHRGEGFDCNEAAHVRHTPGGHDHDHADRDHPDHDHAFEWPEMLER